MVIFNKVLSVSWKEPRRSMWKKRQLEVDHKSDDDSLGCGVDSGTEEHAKRCGK